MKNVIWISVSSIIACILMYVVEQLLDVNYIIKTIVKIIVFTGIPVFYIKQIKKTGFLETLSFKQQDPKSLFLGAGFGFLSFIAILFTYYLLQDSINLNDIALELQEKLGITPEVFIFVAVYVTFGNSLLEEFFFRGYIFLELYKEGNRVLSYVLSSLLFGVYHIAIFQSWFSLPLMLMALGSLIGVSFVFNWLDSKSGNFINSWIVHIFADAAIVLIGFRMFGLL